LVKVSNKTQNQRWREAERASYGSRDLREVAREQWALDLSDRRVRLGDLMDRVLYRYPDSFPEPLKGRLVVAETGGLLFGLVTDSGVENLGLVVGCPVCGEWPAYLVKNFAGLGRLLANADHDPRCYRCVEYNRRVGD
jgi:hypothetical protein